MFCFSPLGRAIADGLRHLFGVHRAADSAELAAMREEVAALQHRIAELEERQDFAERLLAQARERGLLAGPSEP
jgi:cell division protein FtsB